VSTSNDTGGSTTSDTGAGTTAANNDAATTTTTNNSGGSSTSTSELIVTPMKGWFSENTRVNVRRPSTKEIVASGFVGKDGSAKVQVPKNISGPFLIEAGVGGDTYYDESTGALATVPADTVALRGLIPDAEMKAVGITAITEMAVGQIEATAGGISGVSATDVIAANATIGSQFGIADPLMPPSLVSASSTLVGGSLADNYALTLAGLAQMASGVSALQVLHDMRDDIKDGKFDGLKGATPITSMTFVVPAGGANLSDMSTQIASSVQAATTQYAGAGAAAPTVTLTVSDLTALLNAAMAVGAATKDSAAGSTMTASALNTQIANTVQTQVAAINTAVTNAGAGNEATALASAKDTAVTAAQASGAVLANASNALAHFMADTQSTGTYSFRIQVSGSTMTSGYVYQLKLTPSGSGYSVNDPGYGYNNTQTWVNKSTGGAANEEWDLTPTSPGGWVDIFGTVIEISAGSDSSFTVTNKATNNVRSMLIAETKLDGLGLGSCNINNTGNSTGGCPASYTAATYPVGSTIYRFPTETNQSDAFSVRASNFVTDLSGVQLTALPVIGTTSFCVKNSGGGNVFRTTATPGSYTVSWATDCSASAIAGANNGSMVTGYLRNTGNTAAPTVMIIQNCNNCSGNDANGTLIGLVPGHGVLSGWWQPKGVGSNGGDSGRFNKTAYDAMVTAAKATGIAGLVAIPTLP